MDKKVVAKIKKELLLRKKEIEEELRRFTEEDQYSKGKHRPRFINIGTTNDDNAKEIDTYTTDLSLSKVLESNLEDINKALQRIANKTYGICKYCGKEIGEKRLLARPVSSACINCKSKLQQSAWFALASSKTIDA